MKISEFAKATGISNDTIRYYEKVELLNPKIISKHRQYNENDIEIVQTILKLKQTGFTLQEIKMLFKWSENADPHKKLVKEDIQSLLEIKEIFQKKYEQIVQKENSIKQIKEVLLKAEAKISQLLEEK